MRDKESGFGDDSGWGGGLVVGEVLGGVLDREGGLYLPLMAVGMKGGGGPPSVEVEEGVEEQGELGLAVHAGVEGITLDQPSWRIYSDICIFFIYSLGHRNVSPSPELINHINVPHNLERNILSLLVKC